jgi:hypothetical protein
MIKRLLFIFLCTQGLNLDAQQIPIGNIPTQYNGGFAGEAGVPRISSFYATYLNYISYDNFYQKLKTGISFTVGSGWQSDHAGPDAHFNRHSSLARLGISPKFSFKGKYTIAPFLDFTLSSSKDQFNTSIADGTVESVSGSIRTGVLLNTDKSYVGVSFNTYQRSFYENTDAINPYDPSNVIKNRFVASLQAGYTFQRTPDSKFSFTPQLILTYQSWQHNDSYSVQRYSSLYLEQLNLIFRYKKFIGGVNLMRVEPGLNKVSLIVGYQTERFKVQLNPSFTRFHYSTGLNFSYKFK